MKIEGRFCLGSFERMFIWCILVLFLLPSCATSLRPWTRAEKVALVGSIVATGWNIYETDQAIDRGCHEANPTLRWNPTIGMVSTETIAIIIGHYKPKWRLSLLGGKTLVNSGLALHDHNAGK